MLVKLETSLLDKHQTNRTYKELPLKPMREGTNIHAL